MPDRMTLQQTLQQGRAKHAYECVNNVIGDGHRVKDYKSYVKKMPMLIKNNGLGNAIAFIRSKSNMNNSKPGYAYKVLYDHLTDWFKEEPNHLLADMLNQGRPLEEAIISLDSKTYRAATNEALAFLSWLKRFAEGMIEGEADEG